jgi:hypothetical protein
LSILIRFSENVKLTTNKKKKIFFSAVSRHRLTLVQRKTLVLDLDETLIHSHHDGLPRNPSIKPGTPHDFTVSFPISSDEKEKKSIFHSSRQSKSTLAVQRAKRRRQERKRCWRKRLSLHVQHQMIL